jgi:hypothetical protein
MKTYTANVKSTATPYLIGRDAPYGADIIHLAPGTSVDGKGDYVYANGYDRMNLTAPTPCWVAVSFLDNIVVTETPDVPGESPDTLWVSLEEGGEQVPYDKRV